MTTSKKRTTSFFDSHQKSWIFEERGKKAQFYLVAAIIIALVIFSLATINNYAKESTQKPVVFDLKDELNLEAGRVVDFAIYNQNDTDLLMENWTRLYVESQEGKEIEDWIFVYGAYNDITILTFSEENAGEVCIQYATADTCVSQITDKIYKHKPPKETNNITITLGDFSYVFNMTSGQNFAFVIKKEGYVADSTTGSNKDDDD